MGTHNDWECLGRAIAVLGKGEIFLELNALEPLFGTELEQMEQEACSTLRLHATNANG